MSALTRTSDGLTNRIAQSCDQPPTATKPVASEDAPTDCSVADRVSGSHANRAPYIMQASETRAERESAFRLVHRAYREAGLTDQNPMQMRVLKQHLLDTTDVLVAKRREDVCFTVTLVRDGELGLPAESLFSLEVEAMRAAGVKLAEVSCVASDCEGDSKKKRFETLVNMISMTIHVARRRGVDRLLLAVHPRHARLYQRMFGCVPCTPVKDYDAVRGNPAVLCMHDFTQLDKSGYALFEKVYGSRFSPWQLDGMRMTTAEKEYLQQAILSNGSQLLPMAA